MKPYVVVSYEHDEEFDVMTQYCRYFKYAERAREYQALELLKGNDAWVFKTDSEEFEWIKE